jgi:hypothetical protein
MEAVTAGVEGTTTLAVIVHPLKSVTVTVYVLGVRPVAFAEV